MYKIAQKFITNRLVNIQMGLVFEIEKNSISRLQFFSFFTNFYYLHLKQYIFST